MTREEAIEAINHTSYRRTICEVHREIYKSCSDPRIKELVLEAFIMGKKMDRKLKEYKWDWDEGFFEAKA
jgi:hypothetical protein